jgi:hypothetical protein
MSHCDILPHPNEDRVVMRLRSEENEASMVREVLLVRRTVLLRQAMKSPNDASHQRPPDRVSPAQPANYHVNQTGKGHGMLPPNQPRVRCDRTPHENTTSPKKSLG